MTSDYSLQTTVKQKAVDGGRKTVDRQAGFSLIEIMVALAILAIIGVVAVPNFRRFNSDQEINNVTSDVTRLLQQAQSSAQSQIACVNSLPLDTNNPSLYWDFVVNNGIPQTYQLQADCINAVTLAPAGTPTYATGMLTNVSISANYNPGGVTCNLPARIRFRTLNPSLQITSALPPPQPGNRIELICNGTNIAVLSQVILNISQAGFPGRTIMVEDNGIIHQ